MPSLAIFADSALTPLEAIPDAVILVEGPRIVAVGTRSEIQVPGSARRFEAKGQTLMPGFVDIHIHGAGGADVMDDNATALQTVASTLARFGTTSFLPTTVSASLDDSLRAIAQMEKSVREAEHLALSVLQAQPLGVHLEGPFINSTRRGVHPQEFIIPPNPRQFETLVNSASGAARILTLAPELPGALELITTACEKGIVASMGHTDATYDEARAAIDHGATHAAHVFNAMRPFSHRETGVIGAVLTSPEVTAELIADGVHVDAAAMRLLLATKGTDRTILVSDGTAATGMPDGTYRLGTFDVTVRAGVCRNTEGRLAGSTLTLDRAIRNIVALGIPLRDAAKMATYNPARLLRMHKRKGFIATGADADLVLLNGNLEVTGVMTRGVGLQGDGVRG